MLMETVMEREREGYRLSSGEVCRPGGVREQECGEGRNHRQHENETSRGNCSSAFESSALVIRAERIVIATRKTILEYETSVGNHKNALERIA